mmetsp:Transcript_152777/g.490061  ORF Transcript_152777/g.490061 Transcript_152777/m.490061 type:complete len:405 (+) Transcript_152777:105-1319(+)
MWSQALQPAGAVASHMVSAPPAFEGGLHAGAAASAASSPRRLRSVTAPVPSLAPASARHRSPEAASAAAAVSPRAGRSGSLSPVDLPRVLRTHRQLTCAIMTAAASSPMLLNSTGGRAVSPRSISVGAVSAAAAGGALPARVVVSATSLLAESSLGKLIAKVAGNVQEHEAELLRKQVENRELEELLARSREELQQLVSVVSQLHELQQSASEVLPDVLRIGPERPRPSCKPPFCWQPSQEYASEFEVSGDNAEVVTKVRDFEDQGWVIPVGGSLRLTKGGVYRWTICIERKCPTRPQLQLGVHGLSHGQPWRLFTTSRCSWSRDDEPWQDRPGGDRLIDEGSFVHMEVDLRGVKSKLGTFAMAINDEPFEALFDDLPLNTPYPLIPVVSMGGHQSRIRLCPNY